MKSCLRKCFRDQNFLGSSLRESHAREMSYKVLRSKTPVGVGLKGELMERLLKILITERWDATEASRLYREAMDVMEDR